MRIHSRRPRSSDDDGPVRRSSVAFSEGRTSDREIASNAEERESNTSDSQPFLPSHDFGQLTIDPRPHATFYPQTRISYPGDASERAADREADRVTRMPDAEARQSLIPGSDPAASSVDAESQSTSSGGGVALPGQLRNRFEPRFGHDFSQVRIHTDAQANESARALDARAFTLGNHIVFGSGEYAPTGGSGGHLIAHELAHVVQQSNSPAVAIQREEKGDSATADPATSGDLAWEIFSPIAKDAVRSLAPGALKTTKTGEHYKEVIDVVDKLEDSTSKLADYSARIAEIQKSAADEDSKFALKSMGKVNSHFKSIPDALEVDSDALIQEASTIVTSDMFTDMESSVSRLKMFEEIVEQTSTLRAPYGEMVKKLDDAEERVKASFDALGILGDALEDLIKIAVLPVYQVWLFSTSQKVKSYRGDVGTILSTIRSKRDGYQKAIDGSEQMENYMTGAEGRKASEESYRDPKDAGCVMLIVGAIPALKKDPEAIFETVLPYAEATFENIMDSLDFLPIDDSDAFFAITEGLREAFPDREGEITQKEDRYVAGLVLFATLENVRPALESIDQSLHPLILKFVYQEYYLFWVDDPRSLLSSYRFTYKFQIEKMTENAIMLPLAVALSERFE